MPEIIENLVRFSLNKDKYERVNIYCQDESRFGLITKQSKVLSVVGIKLTGKLNIVINILDCGEAFLQ